MFKDIYLIYTQYFLESFKEIEKIISQHRDTDPTDPHRVIFYLRHGMVHDVSDYVVHYYILLPDI